MGDVAVGARSGHEGPEEPEDGVRRGGDHIGAETGLDAVDSESDTSAPTGHGRSTKPKKPRPFWKELPLLVIIALALALVIKTFLVQAFSIPSGSMENTLKVSDRVLVDKLTPWFGSKPDRGEVVVFKDPSGWLAAEPTPKANVVQKGLSFIGLMPSADEKDLIKRVIGVGGDTVECKGDGPLRVNGKPLDEPYVFPGNTPCTVDETGGQFKVKVPEGKLWVMGDHRQASADSRYHQNDRNGGFVPVDNVIGRAFVVAWPPQRWSTLPVPDTFHRSGINAAASMSGPAALGLVGAVPLVLWRRRRVSAARTDG
ncbi:signal peptidase I [Streptomyces sp. NPDC049954]|uniref:signal peptidase I n=1 Tax=Streptomyces sp. NPDC049954 TaxID=3155779 RepID=UPI003448F419